MWISGSHALVNILTISTSNWNITTCYILALMNNLIWNLVSVISISVCSWIKISIGPKSLWIRFRILITSRSSYTSESIDLSYHWSSFSFPIRNWFDSLVYLTLSVPWRQRLNVPSLIAHLKLMALWQMTVTYGYSEGRMSTRTSSMQESMWSGSELKTLKPSWVRHWGISIPQSDENFFCIIVLFQCWIAPNW